MYHMTTCSMKVTFESRLMGVTGGVILYIDVMPHNYGVLVLFAQFVRFVLVNSKSKGVPFKHTERQ